MSDTSSKSPVLIELEVDAQEHTPATAPPVPDTVVPQGQAMQGAIALAARKPSRLARWFWSLVATLLLAAVSVAAWDFATNLIARVPVLGYVITGLLGLLVLIVLIMALKELSAFARLSKLDTVRRASDAAFASKDLSDAREAVGNLTRLYRNRDELSWALARYDERAADQLDADTLMGLAEREVLAPLDDLATKEIEAAARQVATVTAIVPLALADVAVALGANVRMIRRIAEVYGGLSGTFGNWRLVKAVMTHLVATGAVAVGDDMLGSLAGGGVLSKLSRRFGEGVINGALTARVGVAAMDVCRPMGFNAAPRPAVSAVLARALKGLFGSKTEKP